MTLQLEKKVDISEWAQINKDKIGKGIKKPRFRKPKEWSIQNRILMSVMMVEDVKLSELASELNVANRTVAAWIYQGVKPTEEYRAKISFKFGIPQSVLFYDDQQYNNVEKITEKKFYKRVFLGMKINRILTGLFAVHDISPAEFSRVKGLNPATTRKYMHSGELPSDAYKKVFSNHFGLPEDILFYESV
ncbi:hypothetical protein NV379_23130 [Paenibacillus sp. N1-5-1-14]|uniref:hypothetical protein n=1 Tax=Paenibacillus radicibacter TaxID=2972488 RepID=UPI00215938AE|nr:hypothetical protein [Paenibacillus radicibacter]MCR8645535.1 hypothetical protein [Paenibacillus radicibacter]